MRKLGKSGKITETGIIRTCTKEAAGMKKYEYKMVEVQVKLGFDWKKKIREAEARWNELGQEGWQFCMHGNGVLVFMREIEA